MPKIISFPSRITFYVVLFQWKIIFQFNFAYLILTAEFHYKYALIVNCQTAINPAPQATHPGGGQELGIIGLFFPNGSWDLFTQNKFGEKLFTKTIIW